MKPKTKHSQADGEGALQGKDPVASKVSVSNPPAARQKKWMFRCVALALPLLLLVLLEVGLRLAGYGDPTAFFLTRQIKEKKVYVENQQFSRRFFPPSLIRHPDPVCFDAKKPANRCRIFVFGESAAMGDPDPAFAFSRVLEVLLRERYPAIDFEVINTSITAISSHVILPIARDAADKEGDIWVVYIGNNEVVGPFGAGTVFGSQSSPLGLIRLSLALKATRIGQGASQLLNGVGSSKTPKSWGGMEMFVDQQLRPEDPKMTRVYNHFERNLRDLATLGTRSGAQVLVGTMASNLKDFAPLASLHSTSLSSNALAGWEQEVKAGQAAENTSSFTKAQEHYLKALQLDSHYADLLYRLGRVSLKLNRTDEAAKYFSQARDFDALHFRTDTRMNQIIRDTAGSVGVRLVESEKAIASRSPGGLPGDELFYDHVHFTMEGNYWLGLAYAEIADAAIPKRLLAKAGQPKPWLSMGECLQRLGFTEWHRYQGTEKMTHRMENAPFTNQSDWETRRNRWRDTLASLQAHTKPEALPPYLEVYRREVSRCPNDIFLRSGFGSLFQSAKMDERAVEQWKECLAIMPYNHQANYSVGQILVSNGRNEEALTYLHAALESRRDFPEALNALGLCFVNLGKFDEAENCYKKTISLNPDFIESYVNLGLLYSKTGRTNLAVAEYETALKVKPECVPARINLGNLLAASGRLEESVQQYASALTQAPEDPIVHFNLANTLLKLGKSAEAVSHYEACIRNNPTFVEARLRLGLELTRQGNHAAGNAQFQESVRINPDYVDAHYNLAIGYARQGRYTEAIIHFQETLRVAPQFPNARKNLERAKALKGSP